MWKMVLSDLYCGFKPGIKNVFMRFLNYYLYLYVIFYTPISLRVQGKYLLSYYFAIFPMILAMIFFTMYGGRPNKALYLCPLSIEQRRQYFLISWGIRAGLPPLLSLLLESALCILGQLSLTMALLIVASVVFFSMTINLHGNTQNIGKGDKRFVYYSIWNVVVLILGLLTVIFLAAAVGDIKNPRFDGYEVELAIILFFLHALIALTVIVKNFHLVMEKTICYEDGRETNPLQGI